MWAWEVSAQRRSLAESQIHLVLAAGAARVPASPRASAGAEVNPARALAAGEGEALVLAVAGLDQVAEVVVEWVQPLALWRPQAVVPALAVRCKE